MFSFLNKQVWRRVSIFAALIISILSVAMLFIVGKSQNSSAITPDGAQTRIYIKDGTPVIKYYGHQTRWYQVSVNGQVFDAYCAEPTAGDPTGSDPDNDKAHTLPSSEINNMIQLLTYIRANNNTATQELRSQVFNGIAIRDWGYDENSGQSLGAEMQEYAFTHAVIGAIYQNQNDRAGLNADANAKVDNAIALLRAAVTNNTKAWQAAANNQIYYVDGAWNNKYGNWEFEQDIVWIESNPILGTINFQKKDSQTGTTPQPGLSFEGITVKVYNNSGREVYNPSNGQVYANGAEMASGTTNAAGKITFSNLPALNVTYSVKETATNTSYELNPNAVSASLTQNGQVVEVSISNEPSLGEIVVTKADSETGTCMPNGNASLVGTKFEVINNTGRTITYNGNTYANGAKVVEKTISATSSTTCRITFDSLPRGNYTIRETASTGYTATTASKAANLNSSSITVAFTNTTVKGKVTVNKTDSATGTCSPQGNTTFNNTRFELTNDSDNAVYYGGRSIARGAVIDSKTLTNGACSVVFENLPYGKYSVKEVAVGSGYERDTSTKTLTIPTNNNVNVSTTFSNVTIKGKVTVNKSDATTGSCTPQGNATFNDTKFEITNNSTNAIVYGGRTIAKGSVIDTKTLSNDSCTLSFENLPYGTYIVEEVAVGNGYDSDTSVKTITIPTNSNINVSTSFANPAILGDLTVKIIDEDTGSCVNTRGLTFNGAKYTVVNKSTNPVYYNGNLVAKNGTIDTKAYASDNCSITISDLPVGTYEVKQTVVTEGYSIDPNTYDPSITVDDLHPEVTLHDQPIRGDVKFVKMDPANSRPLSNTLFSISSIDDNKDIIESHILVTDENGELNTASSFIPHTQNTNGYDALYDEVEPFYFSSYGTWFGLDENDNPIPVRDSVSALPYGSYVIQELRCDSNLFCTGVLNQKVTITINSANQVIDLGDWDNACTYFNLETVAKDAEDGDSFIELGGEAEIIDTIDYCLKANINFTINGILMDKSTGEPLLINGETIENSIAINSPDDCGQTEMHFTIDTTDLAGKDIVVFESLYYKDLLMTEHTDINDLNQTVTIISLDTNASDASEKADGSVDGDKFVEASETSRIKDTINYCVRANTDFTIKGFLVNKATGEPILINDQPVEESVVINSADACSQTELVFEFDSSELGGTEIIVFADLYYEDDLILQHNDLEDENQIVTIISLGGEASDEKDGDEFVEGNESSAIREIVHYCLKTGQEYTIRGILVDKETGEPVLINDQTVERFATIYPTESCGEEELIFDEDMTDLPWDEVVVFEEIYYDDEIIIEYKNLDDEKQTVDIISLTTYAVNEATSEKTLPLGEDVTIKDTVKYCLKPGLEYTIKGILMDKAMETEALFNGEPVEAEVVFTPEEACGEIEMFYTINTTDMGGKELVIFENLYLDDLLLIEHRDFNNASQTVNVELPVPETGLFTRESGTSDNGVRNCIIVVASVVAVLSAGGLVIVRMMNRR